jgi:3-hydroxyisobutyrate dehydrogenase-like beta-hydroxyacid dehydrogenase
MKVGIAGCGAMGRPMAESLIGAGFDVVAFDVRPSSDFGTFAPHLSLSATDLADTDVFISVVRDVAETEALLFDTQAVLHQGQYPNTVVISSTVSPRYIADLAARVPTDVTLIDAPMSGAPHRARDGSLTFMVGGEQTTVDRLRPLFNAMGAHVHHLGPLGTGAAAKVCNNLVGASGVVAVRAALATAAKYGLDADILLKVMKSSSGSTWYGDNLDKIDWADEGYDAANTMGIIEKDVKSFIDAATDEDPFPAAVVDAIRRLEPLS